MVNFDPNPAYSKKDYMNLSDKPDNRMSTRKIYNVSRGVSSVSSSSKISPEFEVWATDVEKNYKGITNDVVLHDFWEKMFECFYGKQKHTRFNRFKERYVIKKKDFVKLRDPKNQRLREKFRKTMTEYVEKANVVTMGELLARTTAAKAGLPNPETIRDDKAHNERIAAYKQLINDLLDGVEK